MANSGPFSSQIQRAINNLLFGNNTWSGTNTFTGTVNLPGSVIAQFADGSVGAPSITFDNYNTTGFYIAAANQIGVAISGSNVGTWSSGGLTLASGKTLTTDSVTFSAGQSLVGTTANVTELKKSASGQSLRLYFPDDTRFATLSGGVIDANTVGLAAPSTGVLRLDGGNNRIEFRTSSTNRWQIDGNGHFTAVTDNTYDIGASGATRPRTGYFGTSVVVPQVQPPTANTGKVGTGAIPYSEGTFQLLQANSLVLDIGNGGVAIGRSGTGIVRIGTDTAYTVGGRIDVGTVSGTFAFQSIAGADTATVKASAFNVSAGGTMISSSAAFTNGAGALTGTLTNSPVTGNPTKWIPINDNGTTRYIPAW